jgi:putative membrane protein insertion efficiency factor
MKLVTTVFIRTYQLFSSVFAPRCKYYPSCSNYALTAITRYKLKGVVMASYRILRCNPWSLGGVDYVDEALDCADAVKAQNRLVGAR